MGPSPGEISEEMANDPNCAFGFIGECVGISNHENRPGHIYFAPVPGHVVSPEKVRLQGSIELTAGDLRELQTVVPEYEFREYFGELLSLAQVGLLCGHANPNIAALALNNLKLRIVQRLGPAMKRRYLNRLGRVVLLAAVFYVAIGSAMRWWQPVVIRALDVQSQIRPSNYLFMLAVAMLSMWLSFASRKTRFTFQDLVRPEEDMLGPVHRVVYVSGFTSLLALFCSANIAGVSIGNFSTQILGADLVSATIFGAVCGLSEKLLATTVDPHVRRIIEVIGQTKQDTPTTET